MFTISMFVEYILTVVSSKSDNALARLPAAKYKCDCEHINNVFDCIFT